jgi:hypothetical protein
VIEGEPQRGPQLTACKMAEVMPGKGSGAQRKIALQVSEDAREQRLQWKGTTQRGDHPPQTDSHASIDFEQAAANG